MYEYYSHLRGNDRKIIIINFNFNLLLCYYFIYIEKNHNKYCWNLLMRLIYYYFEYLQFHNNHIDNNLLSIQEMLLNCYGIHEIRFISANTMMA